MRQTKCDSRKTENWRLGKELITAGKHKRAERAKIDWNRPGAQVKIRGENQRESQKEK